MYDKWSYDLILLLLSLKVGIALLLFLQLYERIFVKHATDSIFLVYEDFGKNEPSKTTVLSLLLVTHSLEYA